MGHPATEREKWATKILAIRLFARPQFGVTVSVALTWDVPVYPPYVTTMVYAVEVVTDPVAAMQVWLSALAVQVMVV